MTKENTQISISNQQVLDIAKEQLPIMLKEVFGKSYSNPLKDVLETILKNEDFKKQLKEIVLECYREVVKEIDFKLFVKESIVNNVIRELTK